MKAPLTAVLYGTGLISAFAAGWLLRPTAHPETTLARAAHPAQPPGVRIPPKSAHPLTASGESWLDAASADLAAVRAAMQPGVVNQVLIDKLKSSLRLQDENIRLTRWRVLVETMRKDDVTAVYDLFRKEFSQGRKTAGVEDSFYHQWGRIDGLLAAELTAKEHYGEDAVKNILAGWARVEPEAALIWLNQHGGTVVSTAGIKAMANAMAADSPASAVQFIRAHAEQTDFQEALGLEMDFTVRERGLAAAASVFNEIAKSPLPDDYKKANLRSLTAHYGGAPFGALPGSPANNELIEVSRRHLGEPWFSAAVSSELGTLLAAKDPESGVAELDRFTNAKAKELFTYNLFDQWARRNPGSLSEWLTAHRGHAEFDRAAFRLVISTSQSDPEAAKAWAAEIKNPEYQTHLPGILNQLPPASAGQ